MNIFAVNFNNVDETSNSSINIKSNVDKKDILSIDKTFQSVTVSSSEHISEVGKYGNKGQEVSTENDNTVLEQLKNSAQASKENLKALFNKMSGADCAKMEEEGYNLNDLDAEKLVDVVDRIKIILATYCEDYKPTGDLDLSEIKEVVGSTSMANQVAAKLKETDLPDTKKNLDEVETAVKQVEDLKPLSDSAKLYLIDNKLEPSIQNIYKAEHASESSKYQSEAYNTKPSASFIGKEEWNQLKPQIESIISKAGLEVNEQNLSNAKALIENSIPVTENNLTYKDQLDQIQIEDLQSNKNRPELLDRIINHMALGNGAKTTLLTNIKSDFQMISDAINTVNSVDMKETVIATVQDKVFHIQSLKEAQAMIDSNQELTMDNDEKSIQDPQTITNYRQLQEIRILMTAEAGLFLVKQGFNLDTTPIAELVEQLKARETQMYGEDFEQIYEVRKSINDIKTAPDVLIGKVLLQKSEEDSLTITDFSQMGSSLKQKFQQAGQTYESVGTQVRVDLGDSLNKAVAASAQDVLTNLELEDTQMNRDAIRILAYNHMDISKENIAKVKEVYSTLNNLIDNIKPENVLSMIKDNWNPLKTDIKDLNEYLIQSNEGLESLDKYSKFLYKLDKTEGITEEERKQFIGIYKMLNIFRKDAGNAVGTLIKQNMDVTMSNLITAYSSRKASGIDTSVDDMTGMAEVIGTVNYYNNLFASTAQLITPKSLKIVNDEQTIETRSVDNFCENISKVYDLEEEGSYYKEYINQLNQVSNVEESVLRELTDNNLQVTVNNIIASQNLMAPEYFRRFFNLSNIENEDENLVYREKEKNQESGNIKDIFTSILENTHTEDELQEAYNKVAKEVQELTDSTLATNENQSYLDINQLRMMGKEIGMLQNLAQRHKYKIPFIVNDEIGTINLQIVNGSEEKGKLSIRFETKELGNISIECKLDKDEVNIFALTNANEKELTDRLNKVTETMKDSLGINKFNTYINKAIQVPEVNYKTEDGGITVKKLYDIAKTILTGVIKSEYGI